nr:uncharacterized protein LOC109172262 isoform X2 [Ipomoea batatas]GMC55460.1 uncharacterized protein LOC109172262 isoform X2 [Ipomoea batatas]
MPCLRSHSPIEKMSGIRLYTGNIIVIAYKSCKYCPMINYYSTSTSKPFDNCLPRDTHNNAKYMKFMKGLKHTVKLMKSLSSLNRGKNSGIIRRAKYKRVFEFKRKLISDSIVWFDPAGSWSNINQVINTAAIPVLLVDGYNVCGFWAKLKKHFLNGKLDIARQKLIDELVTFSTVREVKVVVVFDAMMSGLPFHKETFAGVDVVYSTETCADAWIEKEAADLRKDGYPEVWVVTSDLNQQIAAYGAGAFVWSCKTLVSEIKTADKELERMLREQRSTSMQGKLLKHNLDPDVVTALKDLRDKLSENELRK